MNVLFDIFSRDKGQDTLEAKDDESEEEEEEEDVLEAKPNPFIQKIKSIGDFFGQKENADEDKEIDPIFSMSWTHPAIRGTPPTPRQGMSMTCLGNELFVFGGTDGDKVFNSLYVYDIIQSLWEKKSPAGDVPSPRHRHSATALNVKEILVFGGSGGDDKLYILDTQNFSWQKFKTRGETPSARWGHSIIQIAQTRLLLFGGHDGKAALTELWELDVSSWKWTNRGRLEGEPPTIGARHTATLIPGHDPKVLVLGGSESGSFNSVHEYNIATSFWEEVVQDENFDPRDKLNRRSTLKLTKSISKTNNTSNPQMINQTSTPNLNNKNNNNNNNNNKSTATSKPPTTLLTPHSRSRHQSWYHEGNVYIFGGVGGGRALDDLWAWGVNLKKWRKPKVYGIPPKPRMDHAVCSHADHRGIRHFIFGGNNGQQVLNDITILVTLYWGTLGESTSEPTTTTTAATATSLAGQSRILTSAPAARLGHTSTLVGNKMYIIGGVSDGIVHNDIRVFFLETEKWLLPAVHGTPPRALNSHTTCLFGGELYIFGGGDGLTTGNGLYIFDTISLSWEEPLTAGQMPLSRYGHAACMQGYRMFVFGGYSSEGGYSNQLHFLDVSTLTWEQPKAQGTPPAPRVGHTLNLVGSGLFVYGGSGQKEVGEDWDLHIVKEVFSDIHILDTITITWTTPAQGGNVILPRFSHSASLMGSKLFIYGGIVPKKNILNWIKLGQLKASRVKREWRRHKLDYAVDELLVLDTNTLVWEEPKVAGISAGSRFRHTCIGYNNRLFFFGGHGGGNSVWNVDTGIESSNQSSSQINKTTVQLTGKETPVLHFLESLNMQKYAISFFRSHIDTWDALYQLTNDDLLGLGMTTFGSRKKLLLAIEEQKKITFTTKTAESLLLFLGRYRVNPREEDVGTCFSVTDTKLLKDIYVQFIESESEFDRITSLLIKLRSTFVIRMFDSMKNVKREEMDMFDITFAKNWSTINCIMIESSPITVEKYLKTRKLTLNEKRFLFDQILRIIEHLHTNKVAQCDIKLSDFSFFGHQLKLSSFDSTMLFETPLPNELTPLYCSPERASYLMSRADSKNNNNNNNNNNFVFHAAYGSFAHASLTVWGLGMMVIEIVLEKSFGRFENQSKVKDFVNGVEIPWKSIPDAQLRHLLEKMLSIDPVSRASVLTIKRHAYFIGGLDTEEQKEKFSDIYKEQSSLQKLLNVAKEEVKAQRVLEKHQQESKR